MAFLDQKAIHKAAKARRPRCVSDKVRRNLCEMLKAADQDFVQATERPFPPAPTRLSPSPPQEAPNDHASSFAFQQAQASYAQYMYQMQMWQQSHMTLAQPQGYYFMPIVTIATFPNAAESCAEVSNLTETQPVQETAAKKRIADSREAREKRFMQAWKAAVHVKFCQTPSARRENEAWLLNIDKKLCVSIPCYKPEEFRFTNIGAVVFAFVDNSRVYYINIAEERNVDGDPVNDRVIMNTISIIRNLFRLWRLTKPYLRFDFEELANDRATLSATFSREKVDGVDQMLKMVLQRVGDSFPIDKALAEVEKVAEFISRIRTNNWMS